MDRWQKQVNENHSTEMLKHREKELSFLYERTDEDQMDSIRCETNWMCSFVVSKHFHSRQNYS